MEFVPNYKKYTDFELVDALDHIDSDAYPERAKEIEDEIYYLQSRFPPATTMQKRLSESVVKEKEGMFSKALSYLFPGRDKVVKSYGSIQAEISPDSDNPYQNQAVSVDLVMTDEIPKIKISGSYELSESYQDVSILLNQSGVERLKALIKKHENDLISNA